MTILAVTYHYVRPISPGCPRLRFLHLDDFRSQLDFLCSNHRPISRDEFISIMNGFTPVTDGFILTFDDGLSDHFDFVFPELVSRGLWGSFYIPVNPFLNLRVLDVHITHAILGKFGGSIALESLELALKRFNLKPTNEFGNTRYKNNDDDAATLNVKRILNYDLEIKDRSLVLDQMCVNLNFSIDISKWYLSIVQMNEMSQNGMIIGSHSVSHRPMSLLSVDQQEGEIKASFDWLEQSLDNPCVRSFAYPYGGFDTFTPDTERLLHEAGSLWSFNTEEQMITQLEINTRPQALSRFDCCNLPFGKSRSYS